MLHPNFFQNILPVTYTMIILYCSFNKDMSYLIPKTVANFKTSLITVHKFINLFIAEIHL